MKNANSRKGMNLIEISIVLIIVAIVIGGIFVVAPKIMGGARADAAMQTFNGLHSALENYKPNNANAYLAGASGLVSANAILTTELGGAAAMRDLAGWSYGCPIGATSTMTITTPALENAEIRDSLIQKINGRYAPWVAVANGATAMTVTKANVNCQ